MHEPKLSLRQLISCVSFEEGVRKKPTPKALRSSEEIAIDKSACAIVYKNGYAKYTSLSGATTIVDLKDYERGYTYNFIQDKKMDLSTTCKIPKEMLFEMEWTIAITLLGESQVEQNIMYRKSDRIGCRVRNEFEGEQVDYKVDVKKGENQPYDLDFTNDIITILDFERAMESLTPKQRVVVVEKVFNDKTTREIASQEGVKKSAIDERYQSGINKLRNWLKHSYRI